MDPEHREEKARKEYYSMIDFVANAQQGIPKICPCEFITKEIVDEDDTYDYQVGKRYFICTNFENDGMHFRQPWSTGMQEEVERLKERFHEHHKLLKERFHDHQKLMKECQALKEQVKKLLLRVAELETASF